MNATTTTADRELCSKEGGDCAILIAAAIRDLVSKGLAEVHELTGCEMWLHLATGETFWLHEDGMTRIA